MVDIWLEFLYLLFSKDFFLGAFCLEMTEKKPALFRYGGAQVQSAFLLQGQGGAQCVPAMELAGGGDGAGADASGGLHLGD